MENISKKLQNLSYAILIIGVLFGAVWFASSANKYFKYQDSLEDSYSESYDVSAYSGITGIKSSIFLVAGSIVLSFSLFGFTELIENSETIKMQNNEIIRLMKESYNDTNK